MWTYLRPAATVLIAAIGMGVFAAQAAAEVNIYSYRQPFLIEPLLDAFTQETGIQTNVVFAKTGLTERLKREGRNSPADLVLTVDIAQLRDLVSAEVLQGVRTDTLERNIPAQYRHPEGLWYGLTTRARVIVAAKGRVPEGDIQSYEDLADPKWRGRICTRSGKHVYNVALTAAMMAHHGEQEAEQWLTGLKHNLARKPQGNDRAQVKAIKEGECDIAVINSYYMGAMLEDPEQTQWANAVSIIFPNQNDRGAHVNISGVALTQSAPHKDDAVKLMEFLSGEQAQALYAAKNNEHPVKPDAPWSELLKSWGEFKVDALPLEDISNRHADAVKLVDRVGYDE